MIFQLICLQILKSNIFLTFNLASIVITSIILSLGGVLENSIVDLCFKIYSVYNTVEVIIKIGAIGLKCKKNQKIKFMIKFNIYNKYENIFVL